MVVENQSDWDANLSSQQRAAMAAERISEQEKAVQRAEERVNQAAQAAHLDPKTGARTDR